MNDITGLTAQIISAHVSGNDVSASQLLTLIRVVHETLATIDQSVAEPPKVEPAVSVHESVFADRIVCLDCGKGVKILKRHIGGEHDLTPDHYRAKWGLPPTYPMVASEYTAQRSQLSKDRWLGRKVVTPPSPPRKRGRPATGK
jgi:predicted transcriptional regulator